MAKKKNQKQSPAPGAKIAKALRKSADFRCDLNSGNTQRVNGEAVRVNLKHYKQNCRRIVAHPSGVVIFQEKG